MKKGFIYVFSIVLIALSSVFNVNLLGVSIDSQKEISKSTIDSRALETSYLEYDYENQNPPNWGFNPDSISSSYISLAVGFVYDIDTMGNLKSGDEIFRSNKQYKSVYYIATIYYQNYIVDPDIQRYDWYQASCFGKIDWNQPDLNLGLGIAYVLPSGGVDSRNAYFLDPKDTINGDAFEFEQTVNKRIPSEVTNLSITNVTYDSFDINFNYLKNDGDEKVKVKVDNEVVYDDIPNDGTNTINYRGASSNQNYKIEIYLNNELALNTTATSKSKPITIQDFKVQKIKDNYDYPQIIDDENGIANVTLNLNNDDNQTINDIKFKLYDQDQVLLNEESYINEIHNNEYLFTFNTLKKGTYWTEAVIDFSNNYGENNTITTSKIEFSVDEVVVEDPTIVFSNISVERPEAPDWNTGIVNLDYDLIFDETKIEIVGQYFSLYKDEVVVEDPVIDYDLENEKVSISNLDTGTYHLNVNIDFEYLSGRTPYSINYQSPDFVLENKAVETPIISNNNLTTTNVSNDGLILGTIGGDIVLNDATNIVDSKVKLNLFNSSDVLLTSVEKDVTLNAISMDDSFINLAPDNYKLQILGTFNVGIGSEEEREIGTIQNILIEQESFRIPKVSLSAGVDTDNYLWFQIKSLETENSFWLDVKEIKIEGSLFYKNFGDQDFEISTNVASLDLQTLKITNTESIIGFLNNIMFVDIQSLSVKGVNTNWEKISSFSVNINSEVAIKDDEINIDPSAPMILTQKATEDSIYLEWTKSVDDVMVDHYLVQVGSEDAIVVNDLNYEIANLKPETDYYIRVAAVDDQGALGISKTVKVTTLENTSPDNGSSFWWFIIIILGGIFGLIIWSSIIIKKMRNNSQLEK